MLAHSRALTDFVTIIDSISGRVSDLYKSATLAYEASIANKRHSFMTSVGKLEALNPLSVMARGYSVAQKNGRAVCDVSHVDIGDVITVRLIGGSVATTVESKITD
jgi:exodeoxyribonuclease VII large subunit